MCQDGECSGNILRDWDYNEDVPPCGVLHKADVRGFREISLE